MYRWIQWIQVICVACLLHACGEIQPNEDVIEPSASIATDTTSTCSALFLDKTIYSTQDREFYVCTFDASGSPQYQWHLKKTRDIYSGRQVITNSATTIDVKRSLIMFNMATAPDDSGLRYTIPSGLVTAQLKVFVNVSEFPVTILSNNNTLGASTVEITLKNKGSSAMLMWLQEESLQSWVYLEGHDADLQFIVD